MSHLLPSAELMVPAMLVKALEIAGVVMVSFLDDCLLFHGRERRENIMYKERESS